MFETIDVPALTTRLAALAPLKKPHLAWPFQFTDADPTDPTGQRKICPMWLPPQRNLLREYVRVTKSCPLSLEYFKPDQVTAAAEVCTPPKATVCVTVSPTAIASMAASEWGTLWAANLRDSCDRMDRLAGALTAAGLEVGAVIVDIETWKIPPHPLANADAHDVGAKHAALSREFRKRWPRALQVGYNRGAYFFSGSSLAPVAFFPPGGEWPYCPSLYVSEWAANQQILERTYAAACADRVSGLVPFVALGGTIPRGRNQWGLKNAAGAEEGFDYGRPPEWAWQAGFELGRDVRVTAVAWWPAPFRTPTWGEQFVDYARGAAGLA